MCSSRLFYIFGIIKLMQTECLIYGTHYLFLVPTFLHGDKEKRRQRLFVKIYIFPKSIIVNSICVGQVSTWLALYLIINYINVLILFGSQNISYLLYILIFWSFVMLCQIYKRENILCLTSIFVTKRFKNGKYVMYLPIFNFNQNIIGFYGIRNVVDVFLDLYSY